MRQTDSSLEDVFKAKLESLGLKENIDFEIQFPIRGGMIADVLIYPNIIVELDGEPWHNYPRGTQKDHFKNKILRERGFKVIRFWGREIEKDIDGCIAKIKLLGEV